MQIILKATNLTVTPSLNEYIERALGSLNKLVKNLGEETEMRVEVGRSTFHHRKGEVFFAEANLKIGKNILRSSAESLTVQAAVDEVHDELRNEIYKFKGKRETIFRRGARSFAKLLKISPLARFRKK
ncbi:MAG: ribosome-associated translation inhibitor RaiA [Patescibacteria group bacterium]